MADSAPTLTEIDGRYEELASREYLLIIDGGRRRAHDGTTRDSIDPSTGRPFASFAMGGPRDVGDAVAAAGAAQRDWARRDVFDRGAALCDAAAVLEEHAEELALLDAIDSGNPLTAMRNDVAMAIRNLRRTIGLGPALHGQVLQGRTDGLHYTTASPYGVVAKIVPYNHPVLFAIASLAPVLLVGNALVLKPAEQTPLSALRIGELLADVLPPGLVNVVAGGVEAGDALVRHPLIKRIGFTGSVRVAQAIQASAADAGIKHVSLELGGKNPMIVHPDVDVEEAAAGAVKGMNLTVCQGQSCGSTSRVYVHEDIHDAFVEALVARHETISLGPAYDEGTDMGPLVSGAHRDRVAQYISGARDEGATLVRGGGLPDGLAGSDGYFLEAAVFSDVHSDMRIAREEVFGPVTCVIPWSDEAAVIEEANALDLALTASVWTRSLDTALRNVDALQAGYVWVNETAVHTWGLPFGGMKSSGIGREEHLAELQSFLETKAVTVRLGR